MWGEFIGIAHVTCPIVTLHVKTGLWAAENDLGVRVRIRIRVRVRVRVTEAGSLSLSLLFYRPVNFWNLTYVFDRLYTKFYHNPKLRNHPCFPATTTNLEIKIWTARIIGLPLTAKEERATFKFVMWVIIL